MMAQNNKFKDKVVGDFNTFHDNLYKHTSSTLNRLNTGRNNFSNSLKSVSGNVGIGITMLQDTTLGRLGSNVKQGLKDSASSLKRAYIAASRIDATPGLRVPLSGPKPERSPNSLSSQDPFISEKREYKRNETRLKKEKIEADAKVRSREELIQENRTRSQALRNKWMTEKKQAQRQANRFDVKAKSGKDLFYNGAKVKALRKTEQGNKVFKNLRNLHENISQGVRPIAGDHNLTLKSDRERKAIAKEGKVTTKVEQLNNMSPTGHRTPFGFNKSPINRDLKDVKAYNYIPTTDRPGSIQDTTFSRIVDKATEYGEKAKKFVLGDTTARGMREEELTRTFGNLGHNISTPDGRMIDDKGIQHVNNIDTYRQGQINEYAKSVRTFGSNIDPFQEGRAAQHQYRIDELQKRLKASLGSETLESRYAFQQNELKENYKKLLEPLTEPGEKYLGRASINDAKLSDDVRTKLSEIDNRSAKIDRDFERNRRIQNRTFGGHVDPLFKHTKTYTPSEGTSGYGLGFKNYMSASRTELGVRALSFMNPLNGSGWEALKNSFGIMTKIQKEELRRAMGSKSYLARLMTPGFQAVAGAWTSMAYTMASDGDLGDFVSTQLSYTAGLQGWRVGTSIAGLATKPVLQNGQVPLKGKNLLNIAKSGASSGVMRASLGVVGGVTGFALGGLMVQGVSDTISDLTSNNSAIAKIAKDFSTRSVNMNIAQNRQTLTSRQAALGKLAKSGLNDRAMLLGNEARIMRGTI